MYSVAFGFTQVTPGMAVISCVANRAGGACGLLARFRSLMLW